MLKKKRRTLFIYGSFVLLLLSSGCTNKALPWRPNHLVAQLYRQYKQEIYLSYHNFEHEMVVDAQQGYARAYFDNDRKQIILTKEKTLDYLVGGNVVDTSNAHLTGYPADVLTNEKYQIAVEILDVHAADLQSNAFNGSKSRVIDLNTQANVIVDGLLFNRCLLAGDYFYGFTFDNDYHQLFDIINLKTMEHRRIKNDDNFITFIYEMGNNVYTQIASKQTAYLVNGFESQEKRALYDAKLPNFKYGAQILKDVAPKESLEHWYIEPPSDEEQPVEQVRWWRLFPDGRKQSQAITFAQKNIIQIMDVSRYHNDQIAFFLLTKDALGKPHALISVFDIQGKQTETSEVTGVLEDDVGRFTFLDYIES